MELTLIVVGLLAATAGLVVTGAWGLRTAAAHQGDLLTAGRQAAGRAPVRWLRSRCDPVIARVRYRIPPGWFFSFSVVLGLSVIALAAAVTGTLVEDVTEGDGVAQFDRPVAGFIVARRSGAMTAVMRAVSTVGSPVVLAVLTVAVGVLLGVLWHSWGPVVVAGVTVAGSEVLTIVFKQLLGRSRPPLADAVATADGYGFPSGHAAAAAAAFGVLAYLCAVRVRSWAGRVVIRAAAATLAVLVGISRVYLGVHWTTDVIGGWAVGVCWLAVVITGWTTFTRNQGQPASAPRFHRPAGRDGGLAGCPRVFAGTPAQRTRFGSMPEGRLVSPDALERCFEGRALQGKRSETTEKRRLSGQLPRLAARRRGATDA